MKKYLNSENITAVVIVVVGVWLAMSTYNKVSGWFGKLKPAA